MSNKVRRQQKTNKSEPKNRRHRKAIMVIGLILCLGVTGVILAQWKSIRSSFSPTPAPVPSPTPTLSKEYIYAGGRLIATEEPDSIPTSPLPAPTALTAIGFSVPNRYINLSWTGSAGTDVHHYQVERCANTTVTPSCYEVVSANVPASGPSINFTDTISSGTGTIAYLYRVRGANASNTQFSDYSQPDLATTITFTDDPLNPEGTKTVIKAQHLTQLRAAVNAVRVLAGIGEASWTYPDPVSSPAGQRRRIFLEDVSELRSKLDEALTALNRLQPYETNPPLGRGSPVSAAHFTQIRERVK